MIECDVMIHAYLITCNFLNSMIECDVMIYAYLITCNFLNSMIDCDVLNLKVIFDNCLMCCLYELMRSTKSNSVGIPSTRQR